MCDEALRVDDARMHIFDQTLVRSQFVGLPACRYVLPSPSLGASLAGLGAGGLVVGAASVTAGSAGKALKQNPGSTERRFKG